MSGTIWPHDFRLDVILTQLVQEAMHGFVFGETSKSPSRQWCQKGISTRGSLIIFQALHVYTIPTGITLQTGGSVEYVYRAFRVEIMFQHYRTKEKTHVQHLRAPKLTFDG